MDLSEFFLAAAASAAPVGTPIDRSLVERKQVRIRVCGGRTRSTGHRKNRAASAGSGRGSADSQTGIGFESCRSGAKSRSRLGVIAKVGWSRRGLHCVRLKSGSDSSCPEIQLGLAVSVGGVSSSPCCGFGLCPSGISPQGPPCPPPRCPAAPRPPLRPC